MFRVTIDSNVLDRDLGRMRKACKGFAVEMAPTTVTLREHGKPAVIEEGVIPESGVYGESCYGSAVYATSPPVYETLVLDESPLGASVLGSDEGATRLDTILAIIASGSFPKAGEQEDLSPARRRQLRDAMILEAHAREGRDVLVSDDLKAFGREKRAKLEALCATRIMTVDEFCQNVPTLATPSE